MIRLNVSAVPHLGKAKAGNNETILLITHAGLDNGYSNYSAFGTLFVKLGILPSMKPDFDVVVTPHNNDEYLLNYNDGCYQIFAIGIAPRTGKKWKEGAHTFLYTLRNTTHHGSTLVTVVIPPASVPFISEKAPVSIKKKRK